MSIELKSVTARNNVVTVTYEILKGGWSQSLLLQSDNHFDSPFCNRRLEEQHLNEAINRSANIIIFGDLFDAMQGKYDPRRDYDDLRPEYKGTQYLDLIVKDAKKRYLPFANNLLMLAKGNHETAVARACNTDLTERLVDSLRDNGSPCVKGNYGGWIRFIFTNEGHVIDTIKLKYYHGKSSNAPVTKGMTDVNRQAVYLPDADIVVNGHNHQNYITANARERLSAKGVISTDTTYFLRIPGYKDDYQDGSEGWLVEKIGTPTSLGAIWLRFYEKARLSSERRKVCFDATLALG